MTTANPDRGDGRAKPIGDLVSTDAKHQPDWQLVKADLYCIVEPILGVPHRHAGYYQVFKVMEGMGEMRIGGQRFAADSGGVFWIPPGVMHSSDDPPNQSPRIIEIRFSRNAEARLPVRLQRFPYHIPSDHEPGVLACFHELVREYRSQKRLCEWRTAGLISDLILLLARALEAQAVKTQPLRVEGYRIDHEAVAKVIHYINENYFRELNLKRLAEVAGMSVSRFCKVFRAVEGRSPIDYLIDFRLQRAQEMMTEPQRKLTHVAQAVGFSSIHHFSSTYRKRIGVSPSRSEGPHPNPPA